MARKPKLTSEEQGVITGLRAAKWTMEAIAKHTGRSRSVVSNYLRDPSNYGKRKSPGRPPKLTDAAKRALLREASKGKTSSNALVQDFNLPVKARRVRQVLNAAPHLKYKRMQRGPMMLPRHRTARVEWAEEKVTWTQSDWNNVIWSDEKKFNLDGPDGFAYYWHDLRKEPQIFSKRQQGGDSLMVWGAFAATKKCQLVLIEGNMNQSKYIDTLESYLLPFIDEEMGPSWVFQQDGASSHRALSVKHWFDEEEIEVMDWPAKSPDLNPIENLWAILSRKVYAGHRQFQTLSELRECVLTAWDEIPEETLDNLVKSMQRRCFACCMAKGGPTKY